MKGKLGIVVGVAILVSGAYRVISQQSGTSGVVGLPAPNRSQPVDPSEAVAPFRINRQTGELLMAGGARIEDPTLNSPEKRQERLLAGWAIEHPDGYWKITKLVLPPNPDPTAPRFDILHPERYTALMQARETAEQRQARELSRMAIQNPLAYQEQLKKLNAGTGR